MRALTGEEEGDVELSFSGFLSPSDAAEAFTPFFCPCFAISTPNAEEACASPSDVPSMEAGIVAEESDAFLAEDTFEADSRKSCCCIPGASGSSSSSSSSLSGIAVTVIDAAGFSVRPLTSDTVGDISSAVIS